MAKRELDSVVPLLLDGTAKHGFLDMESAVSAIKSPVQRKEFRWIFRNLGLGKKLNETIVVCPIRKTGFPSETVGDEVERTVRLSGAQLSLSRKLISRGERDEGSNGSRVQWKKEACD